MGCLVSKKREEYATQHYNYNLPPYAYEGYGYELNPRKVSEWTPPYTQNTGVV